LPNDQDIVSVFVHEPGRKLLVASSEGRGFVVPEDEVIAQTKNGKQVLNPGEGVEAAVCRPVEGDHVAVIGDNRKLLLFSIDEMPEMTRGRGVILQKYKDGGLSDAKTFNRKEGLSWAAGAGRTRIETELRDWLGKRAQAGRLPPNGFPRSNKFG
ncbi:DNA gyrase C-terminal beta-propeller domain-containing protein, partial [Gillisia sp. Q332]